MSFAGFDWAAFASQLIAGLVAALVGIVGVLIGFRLQRRAAYADSMDQAAANLLVELSNFVTQLAAHDDWTKAKHPAFQDMPPAVRPRVYSVSIAVEMLVMRSRGRDRKVALVISTGWNTISHTDDPEDQMTACGLLAGAVTAWRAGEDETEVSNRVRHARQVTITGSGSDAN